MWSSSEPNGSALADQMIRLSAASAGKAPPHRVTPVLDPRRETDVSEGAASSAPRHSFISILVSQGKTWDQIAAFVGHLDQRTTQRYIHFMPKDKRETAKSISFEF